MKKSPNGRTENKKRKAFKRALEWVFRKYNKVFKSLAENDFVEKQQKTTKNEKNQKY